MDHIESRKTPRLLTLASVVVVVAALHLGKEILVPFALAGLLSFLLAPVVSRLERFAGRKISVIAVVFLAVCGIGGFGYLVAGQVTELADMLPRYRENITSKLDSLRGGALQKASDAVKGIGEDLQSRQAEAVESRQAGNARVSTGHKTTTAASDKPKEPITVQVVRPDTTSTEIITGAFSPLLGPLGTAFMVLVLVLFMLLAREDLRDRLVRLAGRSRIRLTTQAMDEAGARVSRYLFMQSVVNVIQGALIATGFFFLGVPNYLLWGLFAAMLRFIPYVGTWVAGAMPILLSLAVFDNWTQPLMVAGYFVAVEVSIANLIEPWLYGSSVGLSPLAVITTAIFWTWLWGPIGLLLATPLTVCIVVMGKYIPQLHFVNILLGDEPVLEPHARFYQRLLAMDQEEAAELAEKIFGETGSLVDVYDVVIIPALGLAEIDRHRDNLDERRVKFIHESLRQMIEDLGELAAKRQVGDADKKDKKEEKEKDKKDGKLHEPVKLQEPPRLLEGLQNGGAEAPPARPPTPIPVLPADLCVLCLPARDEADELVGVMLAQVVRLAGARGETASVSALSSEMADLADNYGADVVCVSALPPSTVAQARYLCKRLLGRFPALNLVVGLWNAQGDLTKPKERLGQATRVVTSLASALLEIEQAAHAVRFREGPAPAATAPRQVDAAAGA